jgi:UDP-N-acetylglucosamine acyltransferase
MANGATLAGHITVEDYATLGGLSAIHQYVRVGSYVMVGGGSMVAQDIPPYMIASGDRATLHGLNLVGLKRRGISDEIISDLKKAYKILVRSNLRVEEALKKIKNEIPLSPEVSHLYQFVETSARGICR